MAIDIGNSNNPGNNPGNNPRSDTIKAVEELYLKADAGISAEVVLKAMNPALEERLGHLMAEFGRCPPELGPLLDLRAKIVEVWRMREEMKRVARHGKTAAQALTQILSATINKGKGDSNGAT